MDDLKEMFLDCKSIAKKILFILFLPLLLCLVWVGFAMEHLDD